MAAPGITGKKVGRPSKTASVPPSERGSHALSIPAAGRMIGLSRGASYEAAKRGEIPTLAFGFRRVVPKAPWLRMLGIEGT